VTTPSDRYYTAKDVLAELPHQVATDRARLGLTQKDAAIEIGISRSSLIRLEAGQDARLSTFRKALDWVWSNSFDQPRS
jgi:predicted transcriptional regulator